ncbi:MAG: tetratricopeptide repeat-containing sensor histidine kinase [Niabella sp.]
MNPSPLYAILIRKTALNPVFVGFPYAIRGVFCFLLLIVSLNAFPQQERLPYLISRWQTEQHAPHDTAYVNLLNQIANGYINKASDSSFYFVEQALSLSRKLKYVDGESMALANTAAARYIKGDYVQSMEAALNALDMAVETDNKTVQAIAHNVLGLVYLVQDNNIEAIRELKTAAYINDKIGEKRRLTHNCLNLSMAYEKEEKYDSVYYYLNIARQKSQILSLPYIEAMVNNHLADYYLKVHDTTKAVHLYRSVLDSKIYQNTWENSYAHCGLANYYFALKEYDKAIYHGQEALALAKMSNAKWDINRALGVLYPAYEAKGNHEQAYRYLLLHKEYTDSLFNEKKEKQLNALFLQRKKIENAVLSKEIQINEQKSHINNMLFIIFGLLLVFLIVLVLIISRSSKRRLRLTELLRRRNADIQAKNKFIQQQNTLLDKLNREKTYLFSIIGHDLRSPIFNVMGMLQLIKSDAVSSEEKEEIFDTLDKQIVYTHQMLENLLVWSEAQQSGIQTRQEEVCLPDTVEALLKLFEVKAKEKKIEIYHHISKDAIALADSNQISVILRNIISNAIKFTHPGGMININYGLTETRVVVNIKDSGVGMEQTVIEQLFDNAESIRSTYGTHNEKGAGIGLKLAKRFIDYNGATIDINSDDSGTCFAIGFLRCAPANIFIAGNLDPHVN